MILIISDSALAMVPYVSRANPVFRARCPPRTRWIMSPTLVGLATLLVGVIVVALALWAGRSQAAHDAADTAARVFRARTYYAVALLAALTVAGVRTLPGHLYPGVEEAGEVVVSVTGSMWAWKLEGVETPLPVGKRIEFRVTAADVNHGLGVYDDAGRLLFQVQAMPKYTNRVLYTFERPGRYHVLCMEFCGLLHHIMTNTLEVR